MRTSWCERGKCEAEEVGGEEARCRGMGKAEVGRGREGQRADARRRCNNVLWISGAPGSGQNGSKENGEMDTS